LWKGWKKKESKLGMHFASWVKVKVEHHGVRKFSNTLKKGASRGRKGGLKTSPKQAGKPCKMSTVVATNLLADAREGETSVRKGSKRGKGGEGVKGQTAKWAPNRYWMGKAFAAVLRGEERVSELGPYMKGRK